MFASSFNQQSFFLCYRPYMWLENKPKAREESSRAKITGERELEEKKKKKRKGGGGGGGGRKI